MNIQVEWDDIQKKLMDDFEFQLMLDRIVDEYFITHDDIFLAVRNKVMESINNMVPYDFDTVLQDKFLEAIVRVENKHQSNIKYIENKLEALVRNMDALYLQFAQLKEKEAHEE